MKKLLSLLLLLPLLSLTSCGEEEILTVGVHYKNGDNSVHYACSSVRVIGGNTLRIRTRGNTIQFLNGDYATYDLPSACPICGYEGELL